MTLRPMPLDFEAKAVASSLNFLSRLFAVQQRVAQCIQFVVQIDELTRNASRTMPIASAMLNTPIEVGKTICSCKSGRCDFTMWTSEFWAELDTNTL
jgi:hypothetical protein